MVGAALPHRGVLDSKSRPLSTSMLGSALPEAFKDLCPPPSKLSSHSAIHTCRPRGCVSSAFQQSGAQLAAITRKSCSTCGQERVTAPIEAGGL